MNESEPDELHFSPNAYLKLSTHTPENTRTFPEDGGLGHVSCRICETRVVFHNISVLIPSLSLATNHPGRSCTWAPLKGWVKPGDRLLHTQLGNLCVWKFKVSSHPRLERLGSHSANLEIGWWRRGFGRWQVVVVTGRRPTTERRSLLIWLSLSYPSIQVSLNVTSSDKSSLSSYSESSFLL